MFRTTFGVVATLLATTGAVPAVSSDPVPVTDRILEAQGKLREVAKLGISSSDGVNVLTAVRDSVRVAQHFGDHHWSKWRDHH